MGRWKRKWVVRGRFVTQIVSLTRKGEWQCDCPKWIYRRVKCIHIEEVQKMLRGEKPSLFEIEEIDPELTGSIIRIADALSRKQTKQPRHRLPA